MSDKARLAYWLHTNAKDTKFHNPGCILILGLGLKHRAPWPPFPFWRNFFKRCVTNGSHELSPLNIDQLVSHMMSSQTSQTSLVAIFFLALSRPGPLLTACLLASLLCPCPFLLAPEILSGHLLPKRENSWRTRVIAPSSVWALAPQPKSWWMLGKWFFGGIPWWIVEWYSLSGSAVDHPTEWSIEWSHIIALKNIFLKQNLCNLNTFTLMSSTHKHGSWV